MKLWFKSKKETPDEDELLKKSIEAKLAEYQADPETAKFETCTSEGVVVQTIEVNTEHEKFKSAWDKLKISREEAMRKRNAS